MQAVAAQEKLPLLPGSPLHLLAAGKSSVLVLWFWWAPPHFQSWSVSFETLPSSLVTCIVIQVVRA